MNLAIDTVVKDGNFHEVETLVARVVRMKKIPGQPHQIEVVALIPHASRARIVAPVKTQDEPGYGWRSTVKLTTTARLDQADNAEQLEPFIRSTKGSLCIGAPGQKVEFMV